MKNELDADGLPICPDCSESLTYDERGNRDDETMGGGSIEYFQCSGCGRKFHTVDNISIYPE